MSDTRTTEVYHKSPGISGHLVRIVNDEEDEAEANESLNLLQHSMNQEEAEDNISLCSDLSVGKENPGGEERQAGVEDEEEILDISDTHSNSSNEEMQHSISTSSQEAVINPFALANTLRFPVPFGLQTNAAGTSTNISPFQEEFLRKSHLYAEELMKHQMQLMAAARASAFSLSSNTLSQLQPTPSQLSSNSSLAHHLNPLAKIGQLSAAAAAALSAAAQQNHKSLNQSHHTHHMLQQQQHHQTLHHHPYTLKNDTLAKLTDLSKQYAPSSTPNATHHMMSTLNQLQTQMQAHLPGLLNDNNDNLHERALKFSIDNILKADFGRTTNSLDSPPQPRKTHHHKSTSHKQKHLPLATTNILIDSLEHSSQILNRNISPSTQTFSTSLATICTNSNDSSGTAVSSSYSSANGAADLIKSSPSQTPTLSPPGFSSALENGAGVGSGTHKASNKTEETPTAPATSTSATGTGNGPIVWPAWVYCTRYSDRPSSGRSPRVRKPKAPKSSANSSAVTAASAAAAAGNEKANSPSSSTSANASEDKRPRTAFSGSQLARLKHEFNENRYLTEKRRQQLSSELGLNEAQIKIWFQNKRAKLKKSSGVKNPLALQLMAQGLYNHSTIPLTREEEELQELQEREKNNSGNNNNNNSLQQQQTTSAVST